MPKFQLFRITSIYIHYLSVPMKIHTLKVHISIATENKPVASGGTSDRHTCTYIHTTHACIHTMYYTCMHTHCMQLLIIAMETHLYTSVHSIHSLVGIHRCNCHCCPHSEKGHHDNCVHPFHTHLYLRTKFKYRLYYDHEQWRSQARAHWGTCPSNFRLCPSNRSRSLVPRLPAEYEGRDWSSL